jgi:hypothetical protein
MLRNACDSALFRCGQQVARPTPHVAHLRLPACRLGPYESHPIASPNPQTVLADVDGKTIVAHPRKEIAASAASTMEQLASTQEQGRRLPPNCAALAHSKPPYESARPRRHSMMRHVINQPASRSV